jgi:hypothetical protein
VLRTDRALRQAFHAYPIVPLIPQPWRLNEKVRFFDFVFSSAIWWERDTVRLVVLNACYSSKLADLLVEQIDCVIGMTDEVSDEAAILFAQTFYSALFDGVSVSRAFQTSSAAVRARYNEESDIPELRCKGGVDPGSVYLVS